MNAEDKQDILDFIDFYVVLGIVHQKTLCKYLGISVRTIQRWRKNGTADKRKGSERKIPRKLKPEERRRIYQELCSPEYKDLNPNEIYNSLLDKGIYLASSRTFYRILKEFNAIYHRTEDRKGNSKNKLDELKARLRIRFGCGIMEFLNVNCKCRVIQNTNSTNQNNS